MKLNPAQHRAVTHRDAPALVLAGAGSGKTGVITRRIAWLIGKRGVDPRGIFAVTFTNKAAREMKQRVAGLLGGGVAARVQVSTFHRLGMAIIRAELEACGLGPGFSIVDPTDSTAIVAELLGRQLSGDTGEAEALRNAISRFKNEAPAGEAPVEPALARVFAAYQRYLRACNSVDLDDMIAIPRQVLAADDEVRSRWRQRVQYLLVDEYQDTNAAQYDLVRLLSGAGAGLMVVGDDDQSIYAWRGALPENLSKLKDDFPGLEVIKLEQNYRSRGRILKLANQLIRNNPRPFEKTLWSELGHGDPVRVIACENEVREAERVVSRLMSDRFQGGAGWGGFAILYRGNHQSRLFEQKLMEMRVPYQVSGGQSFFDRSEIRDLMAYLRLIANPADDSALLRVINTPRRGIGAGTIERLSAFARASGRPLGEALHDPGATDGLPARGAAAVTALSALLGTFQERCGERAEAVIEDLLEALDYRRWLAERSDSVEAAERRWNNVRELVDWIARGAAEGGDLGEVVRRLVLTDMMDRRDEDDADADRVSLMTLHAAKGLEFDAVYIVGVEEDLLPHANSQTEEGIQEERRLFYVGITRARKELTLTYSTRRKRYGEVISCTPSRFLDELPRDELEWSRPGEENAEESRRTGKAHLAGIRALLSG